MKSNWKFLKSVITILVVLFFIYYFLKNKEDFLNVLTIPFEYLLVIVLLNFSILVLNGLVLKVILRSFSIVISLPKATFLSVVSALGNLYLPMRGGTVGQSVYLKKRFKFPYSIFVSMLYGTYIITYTISSFAAILALLFIQKNTGFFSIPLFLFFLFLFLGMLFLSIVKFPKYLDVNKRFKVVNKVVEVLKEILYGWNAIVKNKSLLLSLFLVTIFSFIVVTVIIYFQYVSLGIEVNVLNLVVYNSVAGVSQVVSITPSSLGIREAFLVLTSDILAITNEQVMQLGLLDRGVFFLSLVFSYFLYLTSDFVCRIFQKK